MTSRVSFLHCQKGIKHGFSFLCLYAPGCVFPIPHYKFYYLHDDERSNKSRDRCRTFSSFWDGALLRLLYIDVSTTRPTVFFNPEKVEHSCCMCVLNLWSRRDRFSLRSYKQINYCSWLNIKLWKSLKDIWLPSWPHFQAFSDFERLFTRLQAKKKSCN